jgi:hypothetical protein
VLLLGLHQLTILLLLAVAVVAAKIMKLTKKAPAVVERVAS